MLTPKMNPIGYTNSAVNNMTGFSNSKFLLIHGTGDDNGKKKIPLGKKTNFFINFNFINTRTYMYISTFSKYS